MNSLFGGKTILFVMSLLLLLMSCQPESIFSEEPEPDPSYEGVDPELWTYFERFETEGKNRGYNIDIRARRITAEIEEIDEEHVAGICSYNFRSPNHITIDQEFWSQTPQSNYRELIIFHELGHCYLGQDHREGVLDRNICASIMRSGTEPCFDNYISSTRSYYLDELFDFDGSGN